MRQRPAVATLLLVVWTLGLAGLARADADPRAYSRLLPSVFKVEAHDGNGRVSVGSGVLISEGRIVTNCHVTRNARHIRIAKQGRRWDVNAQVSDLEHDLCVLFAPEAQGRVAAPSSEKPKVGQPVVAIGYVGGTAPRISGGEVRALYRYDGARVIQNTAWFNSGASGGGLFDREGRLIGIIAFRHQGGRSYFFALPLDWIHSARLDPERAQAVTPLGRDLAFWQQAGDRQPFFLRAAALEAAHDWPALRRLAQQWTAVEAGKPDAWLSLGKAHEELGDFQSAIRAYSRAIQSDLECAEAWYGLGVAYASLGQRRELQEVQRVLQTLNGELAGRLTQWVRTH